MNNPDFESLFEKYRSGKCSPEEEEMLEHYIFYRSDKPRLSEEELKSDLGDVGARINIYIRKKSVKQMPIITGIAATVLIFFGLWVLMFGEKPSSSRYANDIDPGGKYATLTLANGQKIDLNSATTGVLAASAGIELAKANDGKVVYRLTGDGADIEKTDMHIIQTPKGGEYQVLLSDGTKVWLNAATTLQYPALFKGNGTRTVRLVRGEAYFEVAKDKVRPFIVTTGQQQVLVLGTHFNINAYGLDLVKTTLLEGSVKVIADSKQVNDSKVIQPGQQALVSSTELTIKRADLDLELAWQKGKIEFMDADIKSIMAMLERWYNIEVVFHGTPIETLFTGSVSRNKSISEILKLLESTGDVHFKIEGRRVEILK